jgi:uncharacterized membrane protein
MLSSGTLPDPRSASTGAISCRSPFFLILASFLLLLGSGLRMYHLGNRSLWFDEALTANTSRTTLTHMIEATRSRGSAPVVHPYLLYLTEKVNKSAGAARSPSSVASILAILVLLVMVRAGISAEAALFAAAILAVSASQVRYAQEVREYSLAVLLAAILIYCLLRWEAAGDPSRQPFALYATLFIAPLVQYGLVLFGFAILSTIAIRLLTTPQTRFKPSHLLLATVSLGAGGVLSLFFTLRFQFHVGQGQWYLASNYYDPKETSLLSFLASNSKELMSFFIPGQIVSLMFLLATAAFLIRSVIRRQLEPLTTVVFSSFAIIVCAALAKIYPFGGIRQCLFLSPGLILFAGVVFADLLRQVRGVWRNLAVVSLLAIILFSGYRGILRQEPYAEYEDTLSVLRELKKSAAPNDLIWVNHDAVEAVDFYLEGSDPRFVYGKYHPNPEDYIPEVSAAIAPKYNQVWLIFSHLQQPSDFKEKELIVGELQSTWKVQSVLSPKNTELFVARRKPVEN